MSSIEYQVLGQFLASVCRLHRTKADRSMDRIGLYCGPARLLLALAVKEGMTHMQIAVRLRISAPAATKVIQHMEEVQHVQRCADRADERVWWVFLRDKGARADRADQRGIRDIGQDDVRRAAE